MVNDWYIGGGVRPRARTGLFGIVDPTVKSGCWTRMIPHDHHSRHPPRRAALADPAAAHCAVAMDRGTCPIPPITSRRRRAERGGADERETAPLSDVRLRWFWLHDVL